MAASRRSARVGRRSGWTPVDRLRAICLALPETTEKVAWGEPTWRVRGRLFAQLDDHHHGADHGVAARAARGAGGDDLRGSRWVGVRIDRRPDWALLAKLIEQAYRQVAPPAVLKKWRRSCG
ncbi:MAG: MmcQ/YjbR family DNA-binding protein [Candidatus Rokuibacteriota bacterium]